MSIEKNLAVGRLAKHTALLDAAVDYLGNTMLGETPPSPDALWAMAESVRRCAAEVMAEATRIEMMAPKGDFR